MKKRYNYGFPIACSFNLFTALNVAAAILQVDPFTLRNALTFRVINTGGAGGRTSTYNVPQNKVQAEGARDALAKTIYSRIFDYLIEKTNQALSKFNLEFACVIGVLDIYGFEIFDVSIASSYSSSVHALTPMSRA